MTGILDQIVEPIIWMPTLVCILALSAYHHYENVYTYWEKRNVKGIKPIVPILPEIWNVLTKDRLRVVLDRREKLGKIYGSFFIGQPQLVVCDPEVIRQIAIKDFDSFQDHQINEWTNKYQKNFLLWLKGEHWRRVRALMTPSFTSGKIKRMYRLLEGCAQDLVENFSEQLERARANGEQKALVNLFDLFGMYTMDGITTCCYGIKLKREQGLQLASSRDAFVKDANQLFKFNLFRFMFVALMPKSLLQRFGISLVSDNQLQSLADRVERLIELRRQGTCNKYDDLLQLLIDARLDDKLELSETDLKENHHASLTPESILGDQERLIRASLNDSKQQAQQAKVGLSHFEILAESMFLLSAGLDTTRSSLSTISYLLAHNAPAQERLYKELAAIAKRDDEAKVVFDYDELTSCDYLDAVISEALRMFGPVPLIDRVALNDYHIGKYNVDLPKGSRVLLGLHSVHNDPDYWHEPEMFEPERFMPGQREKIVAGTYVPFSLGPRHCIGMRFSLTETKLGLARLLMEFKFEPAPGNKYPPEPNFGLGLVSIKNCRVYVASRKQPDNNLAVEK